MAAGSLRARDFLQTNLRGQGGAVVARVGQPRTGKWGSSCRSCWSLDPVKALTLGETTLATAAVAVGTGAFWKKQALAEAFARCACPVAWPIALAQTLLGTAKKSFCIRGSTGSATERRVHAIRQHRHPQAPVHEAPVPEQGSADGSSQGAQWRWRLLSPYCQPRGDQHRKWGWVTGPQVPSLPFLLPGPLWGLSGSPPAYPRPVGELLEVCKNGWTGSGQWGTGADSGC